MICLRAGFLLLLAATFTAQAQSVGIGTTAPDASAALEVRSTSQGLLVPRLTQAQRQAIASPAAGLLVYQHDGAQPGFWYYAANSGWTFFNPSADNLGNHTATQTLNLQANALTGTGASIGTAVGVGVRADGGLNLGQNTAGSNVFIGYQAGQATTYIASSGQGRRNQFGGYQSGYRNTRGSNNVFSGYLSGYANTAGTDNVFSGYRSGNANTTGNNNLFSGSRSGQANTTGSDNVFSGNQGGYLNTTGSNNVFSGARSGFSNTTGSNNVFSGSRSGYNNTTGFGNVFSGYQSGYNNTTGNNNQFSGYQSGYSNTTGQRNLFIGYQSGYSNTTSSYNIFVGEYTGADNTTGTSNVFLGSSSGNRNTTGSYNMFVGYGVGFQNTTGRSNTFSGYASGEFNYTGSYNTALGANSGPINGFSSGNLTNTTALGYGATVSASNTIQLGNANVTSLRCQVGLTVTSDARFKYDVQADVPGLAFISRLRPVTYRLDAARLTAFQRTGQLPAFAPDSAAAVHTGFLAQEVAQAARQVGFVFDGVQAPASARDHYGLGYAQFVVPLVKAVQEQQAQIEALQSQLQARAAQANADHARLLQVQQQVARLLGEAPAAQASR